MCCGEPFRGLDSLVGVAERAALLSIEDFTDSFARGAQHAWGIVQGGLRSKSGSCVNKAASCHYMRVVARQVIFRVRKHGWAPADEMVEWAAQRSQRIMASNIELGNRDQAMPDIKIVAQKQGFEFMVRRDLLDLECSI